MHAYLGFVCACMVMSRSADLDLDLNVAACLCGWYTSRAARKRFRAIASIAQIRALKGFSLMTFLNCHRTDAGVIHRERLHALYKSEYTAQHTDPLMRVKFQV
jgi:hypothetical protein